MARPVPPTHRSQLPPTTPGAAQPGSDAEFRCFFEEHRAGLVRLARLLLSASGGAEAADDLAADALLAVWRRWDRVRTAEHPLAYARGVVTNLARSRIRSGARERRRVALVWPRAGEAAPVPDVPAVLDVRAALGRLPYRKRACVVLRHAFDLSERETARALGISVGTVKSQTSRGLAELARLLTAPEPGDAGARPGNSGESLDPNREITAHSAREEVGEWFSGIRPPGGSHGDCR
ncbi:SigE family RNA polymerase sigma factor [Streptomyces sp. RFCAC02]|uniref:SigE family RNA polymerase sigma factor n=1 Tax=Streptomyces sp. RFCAC02 TaxID=2499143 RepID=UPI0010205A3A|nr:SigE family RNA polymerase sigma factor [Streptomyces sp. RFCAC02]